MSISVETLAVAKKYTNDSLAGAGAVAGVPCQIQSKTAITGGTRITFLWVDNNGDSHTTAMDVMNGIDGQDGKGIQSVSVNENNHLIITYSDGTTTDAGQIEIHSAVDSVNGKTGTVVLDAEDVGALPDDTPIPTKTSDLTNDSGFITKAVSDLANYYLKSATYSKTEVDDIVTAIKNSRFEVVATLPTTDIKTNVIYLVPKNPTQTSNAKDEYINLDGTTAGWEKIGDTEIDLSGYVTTEALNTALANYTTTTDLTTLLAAKQDTLTFDNVPTANSNNPVKSGGVYADEKAIYEVMGQNGEKNLLDATARIRTGSAVSQFSYDGQTIIVNGNLGDAHTRLYPIVDDSSYVLPAGTYILSGECSDNNLSFTLRKNGTAITSANPLTTPFEFSANGSDYFTVLIHTNAATYTNATAKAMICPKSWYDIDPTYQPYAKTNQQLTKDTTALLDNVEVNGAVNMLPNNNTTQTINGVTFTVNDDGTINVSGTATANANLTIGSFNVKAGTSYTISDGIGTLEHDNVAGVMYATSVPAQGEAAWYWRTDYIGAPVDRRTAIANYDAVVTAYIRIPSGATVNYKFKPMFTLASYNGDYVPYAKTNQELTLDSVDWDDYSVLGAVNILENKGSTKTLQGVKFTIQSDKSIILKRESTGINTSDYVINSFTIKKGKYRLKGTGTSDVTFQVTDDPVTKALYNAGVADVVMTFDSDTAIKVRVSIYSSKDYDNVQIYPMIVPIAYKGDYQPYAMTNQELTKVNVAEVNILIQTAELAQYRVRRSGKVVECTISLQVNEAVTAWTDFATVPEGFRPSTYIQAVSNKTMYTGFAVLQIAPNGGIQSAVNLAVGDRVRFTAVWICP